MKRNLPDWLKTKIPSGKSFREICKILDNKNLHSVCKEANCPNIGECFNKQTATFLIMGNICTRNCRYCNIEHGKPKHLDLKEPINIAKTIKKLGLSYVVITSVTRDDLPDYGSEHFKKIIQETKLIAPNCKVEILTPDFNGDTKILSKVLDEKPYCFNHNIEVAKDLFAKIRPEGNYETSLKILKFAKQKFPNIMTKSGFMIGLGETKEEIIATLYDLKKNNVEIVTIGQYLQPRKDLVHVSKFYTPKEFKEIENISKEMGFKYVFSGPLVRSSYNASKIIKDQ